MRCFKPGVYYMAHPYTGDEFANFERATVCAAELIKLGYVIHSPISHGHYFEQRLSGKTWVGMMAFDIATLDGGNWVGLILCPGWEKSKGCLVEKAWFEERGLLILYYEDLVKESDVGNKEITEFETGATRDAEKDKLNYIRALCPLVMRCYVTYIGEHRRQSNGDLRDWDNWKRGIPKQRYLEGLDRHKRAVWLLHEGFPAFDNRGPVNMKDSLCGVIFGAMGMLREVLMEELE